MSGWIKKERKRMTKKKSQLILLFAFLGVTAIGFFEMLPNSIYATAGASSPISSFPMLFPFTKEWIRSCL